MVERQTVNLEPLQLRSGRVLFLRADVPVEHSPFVLVHYAIDGNEQSYAHRLDVDKRVFADQVEGATFKEAKAAAETITHFLSLQLHVPSQQ